MKLAIVDDNKLEQELISTLFVLMNMKETSPLIFLLIVTVILFEYLCPWRFDLIFMDIYLNELNGIDIVRKIRQMDSKVMIVFLTTSKEYILKLLLSFLIIF